MSEYPPEQSISSMQMTNYGDSEFMINAYKKKKQVCDKQKRQILALEQEVHVVQQRIRMAEMENDHLRKQLKKSDERNR